MRQIPFSVALADEHWQVHGQARKMRIAAKWRRAQRTADMPTHLFNRHFDLGAYALNGQSSIGVRMGVDPCRTCSECCRGTQQRGVHRPKMCVGVRVSATLLTLSVK